MAGDRHPHLFSSSSRAPRQFARHFGYGVDAVLARVHDGTLPATMRNDTGRIGGDNHAPAPDLGPADAASTAALDRLAVTLGVTADLLCSEQPRTFAPASEDCAALTGRLLALTVVAARHALSRLPLADADRPLVVGRYAEQVLDDLGSLDSHGMLDEVASFHPPPRRAPESGPGVSATHLDGRGPSRARAHHPQHGGISSARSTNGAPATAAWTCR